MQKEGISPPFANLKSFAFYITYTLLENYRVLELNRLLAMTCVITIISAESVTRCSWNPPMPTMGRLQGVGEPPRIILSVGISFRWEAFIGFSKGSTH